MAFCPERLFFIWNFLNYFDFCDCLFCQNKREIWKEIVSYNFYWWNQESFAGTAKNSSGQKHYKSPNFLLLLIPLINHVNNIVSSSKYTKAFYCWKPEEIIGNTKTLDWCLIPVGTVLFVPIIFEVQCPWNRPSIANILVIQAKCTTSTPFHQESTKKPPRIICSAWTRVHDPCCKASRG